MRAAHPEVDYEGGVSAVLCNTSRGVAAIDAVKPRVQWGESSLDKVLPGNPSLVRSVTPYEKRGRFMADLGDGMGIDELMSKYDFRPSLARRVRGKLGGVRRKVLGLLGR